MGLLIYIDRWTREPKPSFLSSNLANIQMSEVPRILRHWRGNIRVAHGEEVMAHLGSLTDLISVESEQAVHSTDGRILGSNYGYRQILGL